MVRISIWSKFWAKSAVGLAASSKAERSLMRLTGSKGWGRGGADPPSCADPAPTDILPTAGHPRTTPSSLRFQVNYLSGFLLTKMLLPRLLTGTPARIVNVSSLAQSAIDFDDVMIERNFSGRRAYGQSKHAQILFTFDLARELEGQNVIVSALHPATFMDTGMVRRSGRQPRATVGEGADAVMQLVTDDIESGQFFNGLRVSRAPNQQAYDEQARARLKRLSEELTGAR